MAESMPVAVGGDEKFAVPMAMTVYTAIQALRPGERMAVYVVDGGLSAASRNALGRMVGRAGPDVTLTFLEPDTATIRRPDLPLASFDPMVYLRLLLPALLPPELSHVIYLDSDTLVRRSLVDLWEGRRDDVAVQGVPDYSAPFVSSRMALSNWETLGLPADAPYINSGVMLINLAVWRGEDVARQVIEFNCRHPEVVRFADQDGINAVLCRRCAPLDFRWNVPAYLEFDRMVEALEDTYAKRHAVENRRALLAEGAILHFIGSRKPWARGLASWGQLEWLKQLRRSGWYEGEWWSYLSLSLPVLGDFAVRQLYRSARRLVRS